MAEHSDLEIAQIRAWLAALEAERDLLGLRPN
jgi:hypothetical protein